MTCLFYQQASSQSKLLLFFPLLSPCLSLPHSEHGCLIQRLAIIVMRHCRMRVKQCFLQFTHLDFLVNRLKGRWSTRISCKAMVLTSAHPSLGELCCLQQIAPFLLNRKQFTDWKEKKRRRVGGCLRDRRKDNGYTVYCTPSMFSHTGLSQSVSGIDGGCALQAPSLPSVSA